MSGRTVVVTDGEQRAALAVVRSLGSAGYRCVVASASRGCIAGASRFVARSVEVPDSLSHPQAFADAITTLAADEHACLIMPIAEASLLAILPVRSRLLPAIVPFADAATFEAISDKKRLLAEAEKLGIAVPYQVVLGAPEALAEIDPALLTYPLVIKPSRSVGRQGLALAKQSVAYAADETELARKLWALSPAAFPVLLQQRIVGPGIGVFLLLWNGEERGRFAHRRLTEKPPWGGISVYRESVAVDDGLLKRSRALLDRFGWSGVAMVEYKLDSTSGLPYLMEVNGRFWGSLQLAIDAGVDFPQLLAANALGYETKPQLSYRIGVRSRWWWGQIDHLVTRVRRRGLPSQLPPGTRSATRALGDLLLGPFRRDDYEEVLRWNDPRPFLNETMQWMRMQ